MTRYGRQASPVKTSSVANKPSGNEEGGESISSVRIGYLKSRQGSQLGDRSLGDSVHLTDRGLTAPHNGRPSAAAEAAA